MQFGRLLFAGSVIFLLALQAFAKSEDPSTPEDVLRALVQANAAKDLAGMERFMSRDPDMISYTVGGRKYVGWADFARDMRLEFDSVERLEIPITDLAVWTRGDTAWFAMELDYIRHVAGEKSAGTVIPLRETGVLERRNGTWILVAWHESARSGGTVYTVGSGSVQGTVDPSNAVQPSQRADLSGEWDIQEEDKSYKATLDHDGNGTYTWQNGKITTTGVADQKWQGTWHQSGNDREGAFEVLLSEDGTQAKGVWWYTRVGDRKDIPPRQWGGSYLLKRLTPSPNSNSASTP
jgi:hypothetical protein